MAHVVGILQEIWTLWLEMGIYLVFGFAVAGVLSRMLRDETIVRHLGADSLGSVVKASLFGIPLPLCSCGVIPVGLSLRKRGASRGATTSFLISTPQTGVDSILITYAFLGPIFALVRPVAAFVNGLLGGGLVNRWARDEGNGAVKVNPDPVGSATRERVGLRRHASQAARYAFLDFPREIVGWLIVGIVMAGVVAYVVPDDLLGKYLGGGLLPMALMAVVGVPLYICATASVPIVAVLMTKGLSAGAALVFLVTGPATNTASLLLIARALGKRATGIYLGSIVVTSLACGMLLDVLLPDGLAGTGVSADHSHDSASPLLVAGAVGLTVIVVVALWRNGLARLRKMRAPHAAEADGMMVLRVSGMTCSNCAAHVREAAEGVDGVTSAAVDLDAGVLRVAGPEAARGAIAGAVESAGYRVAG